MRYNIFQLTREPVEQDDRLTEYDVVQTHFIPAIAEKILEPENEKTEINYLIDSLPKHLVTYNAEEASIVFHDGIREFHFAERFKAFKRKSEELTFSQFINSYGAELFGIKTLMTDKYNIYVWCEDDDWMPIDQFIRRLEIEKKYYFGGVLVYQN